MSHSGLDCGYHSWAFRSLLWSLHGRQNIDLKQIDCQIFLKQRWVYLGLAENCNLRFITMSLIKVLTYKGRRTLLQRGKGSLEDYSKQRVQGFSLAESLLGKKRDLSSSCWALLSLQHMRALILVFWIYLRFLFIDFLPIDPMFNVSVSLGDAKILLEPP